MTGATMATSSRSENRYRPHLVLVDGRHMLYRAADVGHALTVEREDGALVPVGGIYGFLNMLLKLKRRYTGAVSVAWEGRQNFRHVLYPDYKRKAPAKTEGEAERNREFMTGLQFQEEYLRAILSKLGVRQFSGVGGEADDVLGTLVTGLTRLDGERTIGIYTGDSDLRQLVSKQVRVIAPMPKGKDKVYDCEAVWVKHDCRPGSIPLLKALAGDSSDNIPGIPGVGDKTAAKLIREYGELDEIIASAESINDDWILSERFRGLVLKHREVLPLYLNLTTIRCGIRLIPHEVDFKPMEARHLMSVLKFKRLLERGPFTDLTRLKS